jgi:type VI secretion system protein ImpJ
MMAGNSKVIWSEGMFLRPQHFQQQDRYIENYVNNRCLGLQPYSWGIYDLKIDTDLLKIGQLALSSCSGLFPDGTPFNLPEDDDLPLPLEIPGDMQNELVYLALPLRQLEAPEIDSATNPGGLVRFRLDEWEIKDNNRRSEIKAPVQVGKLNTRLMRQSDERSGFACLGIARIIEARADKKIVLDDQFIPANLNCIAVEKLRGFLNEIHGLLSTRGEAIAVRLSAAGHGGVAEIADFLLLQMVNRYQMLFEHFARAVGIHPEDFYRFAIQLAGELAVFFRADKRPAEMPPYRHDDLQATYTPLMEELRQLLGKVYEPSAVQIPLKGPKYGTYAAKRPDLSLLKNAVFVLAARAEIPTENMRSDFPRQSIIGPVEEIRQYVSSLTPGISIHPLAVAPRQIPYHAGYTYFELDKQGDIWNKMNSSGGFAIHIGGNYPGLALEFWAIKEG